MSGFQGFPKEAVTFFQELRANNKKTWFEAYEPDYRKYVVEPAGKYVVDMVEKLQHLSPGVHAEPRVNRSIFRIYFDTRFSKDKTP